MSRKGKLPIPLPKSVEVKISDTEVLVNGPKGSLQQPLYLAFKLRLKAIKLL